MKLKTNAWKSALLCCLALLGTVWTTQALAAEEAKYACKCKGIKEWILFVPTYSDCGNGYQGADKGAIRRNIDEDYLTHFIPPGTASRVVDGNGCGYYESSGWNCGKMKGGTTPSCLND